MVHASSLWGEEMLKGGDACVLPIHVPNDSNLSLAILVARFATLRRT